jgi:hypothetical protein
MAKRFRSLTFRILCFFAIIKVSLHFKIFMPQQIRSNTEVVLIGAAWINSERTQQT